MSRPARRERVGWITVLEPLSPGRHEIIIHVEGTYLGDPVDFTNTTTLIVQGRGQRFDVVSDIC